MNSLEQAEGKDGVPAWPGRVSGSSRKPLGTEDAMESPSPSPGQEAAQDGLGRQELGGCSGGLVAPGQGAPYLDRTQIPVHSWPLQIWGSFRSCPPHSASPV